MKHIIKFYFLLFVCAIFIIGAYLYTTTASPFTENMDGADGGAGGAGDGGAGGAGPGAGDDGKVGNSDCADLLIKKGNALLLYNTKKPDIKGENPIAFYNLDEYKHYLELQRKKGIQCPVLYLQQENDTQGNPAYRVQSVQDIVLPNKFIQPMEPQLPAQFVKNTDANTLNPPYNQNMYSGYDATSQNVGRITELDLIHASTENVPISDNAMDTNWGGTKYSQLAVESGKYSDNVVTRINYPTPKGGNVIPIDNPYVPRRIPDVV
jgi:hypothetical protein